MELQIPTYPIPSQVKIAFLQGKLFLLFRLLVETAFVSPTFNWILIKSNERREFYFLLTNPLFNSARRSSARCRMQRQIFYLFSTSTDSERDI